MNTDQQTKSNIQNNANNTTSDEEVTVENDHENEERKTNTDIVINIEEPATGVTENGKNKNIWVMFFGMSQANKTSSPRENYPWKHVSFRDSGLEPQTDPPQLAYKPEERNSFVKLVMTIVLIMILATGAFVGYVLITPDVREFFFRSRWVILIPAMGLLMIADYGMMCSPCARQPPCNIIFLILTVIAMSLISAKITAHYETEAVLYGILATAAAVFVCILLACSNFDFTRWMLYVIVIGTALSVIMIIILALMMFTEKVMKPVVLAILVASTLIQCIFLTIQLQMIIGGKTVELNESDYALGAFMVYTAIIDIFLKMVQMIGLSEYL